MEQTEQIYSDYKECKKDGFYSTYTVARALGVDAPTLRKWDASGKFKPHHTTSSGHRYYTKAQLDEAIAKFGVSEQKSEDPMAAIDAKIKELTVQNQEYSRKIAVK